MAGGFKSLQRAGGIDGWWQSWQEDLCGWVGGRLTRASIRWPWRGRLPLCAAGRSRAVGPISLGTVQMRSCVLTREGAGGWVGGRLTRASIRWPWRGVYRCAPRDGRVRSDRSRSGRCKCAVAVSPGRAQAGGSEGEWGFEPGRARPSKARPPKTHPTTKRRLRRSVAGAIGTGVDDRLRPHPGGRRRAGRRANGEARRLSPRPKGASKRLESRREPQT